MKIAVITGCLGFLGKHLTRRALKKGWRVFGIDKINYCSDLEMLNHFESQERFKFLQADIADLDRLPRCDYVINTAAESHVAHSIADSEPFIVANVDGVRNLLELIREKPDNSQPLLMHISTDEVYGDIDDGFFTEESLPNPSNPYSASKAAGDMLVMAWARTYGVKYNIMRPTNFYGVGQYPEKLVPLVIDNLDRGIKIPLHNSGEPIRTWLHVEDAIKAIFTILEKGQRNEVYNCSGGYEQKNWETVAYILQLYCDDFEFDSAEPLLSMRNYIDLSYDREGQDIRYALDDEKLRKLGWKPERIFEEEIVKIVKFHKGKFIGEF